MNLINYTRSIVLSATLLVACAKQLAELHIVTPEEYDNRECWFRNDGNLSAFLILAQEDRIAVPYLVSLRCLVNGQYTSDGEAILHHLNTIRLSNSNNGMQRAFPDFVVSSNTLTDQPIPSSDSKVLYFRARVTELPGQSRGIYLSQEIFDLVDVNISFGEFLALSREERGAIAGRYVQVD